MGIFNIFSQSPDLSFEKSIYDFTVKDIYGEDFKFEKLKEKNPEMVENINKLKNQILYNNKENEI